MIEIAEQTGASQTQTIVVENKVVEALTGLRNLMEIIQRTCGEERNDFLIKMVVGELPHRERKSVNWILWQVLEGIQDGREIKIKMEEKK